MIKRLQKASDQVPCCAQDSIHDPSPCVSQCSKLQCYAMKKDIFKTSDVAYFQCTENKLIHVCQLVGFYLKLPRFQVHSSIANVWNAAATAWIACAFLVCSIHHKISMGDY